jgi:hypothetical protein
MVVVDKEVAMEEKVQFFYNNRAIGNVVRFWC